MRFLVDANLPRSAVQMISRLGHEVTFVRDTDFASAADEVIASRARIIRAALVTRDLGFGDVRIYPPESFAGLIVLRLPDTAVSATIADVLRRFLSDPSFLHALPGRLAIVELDRVRFRPPIP